MLRSVQLAAGLVAIACLAALAFVPFAATSVRADNNTASAGTYADYSMMYQRRAGQFFSGGAVAGQWSWTPQPDGRSHISWGDPKSWPPTYYENFYHDGDWVMLDGWQDKDVYYTLRVTKEELCEGNGPCKTIATSGPQHYTKWNIPASGSYTLKAWGKLTGSNPGSPVVDFGHTQTWSAPESCSNQDLGKQSCIKQWESWWDNNGAPGTPIKQKLAREQLIARGLGMAFGILQSSPSNWRADMHSSWNW
ncbi:MAG: hypothetical protein ACREP9_07955 [Candidatus Dormibacteraceae bacterium]